MAHYHGKREAVYLECERNPETEKYEFLMELRALLKKYGARIQMTDDGELILGEDWCLEIDYV